MKFYLPKADFRQAQVDLFDQHVREERAEQWAQAALADADNIIAKISSAPRLPDMAVGVQSPVLPPPAPPAEPPPLSGPAPPTARTPEPITNPTNYLNQQGLAPVTPTTVDIARGSRAGNLNVDRNATLGQIGDIARQLGLGEEGARVAQAIAVTEGGIGGAVGDLDRGRGSFGPYQFFADRGQLPAYAASMGVDQFAAGEYARNNPLHAAQWALQNYLGNAIKKGMAQGLTGADLATFAQRFGQVSESPERAGANYNSLFGGGAAPFAVGGGAPAIPAPQISQQQSQPSPGFTGSPPAISPPQVAPESPPQQQATPDRTQKAEQWATGVTQALEAWLGDRERRGLGDPSSQELSAFLSEESKRSALYGPGPQAPDYDREGLPKDLGQVYVPPEPVGQELNRATTRALTQRMGGGEPTEEEYRIGQEAFDLGIGAAAGPDVSRAGLRKVASGADALAAAPQAKQFTRVEGGLVAPVSAADNAPQSVISGLINMARQKGVPEDRIADLLRTHGYSEVGNAGATLMRKLGADEVGETFGRGIRSRQKGELSLGSQRYYHGTASDFDTPDPGKFDPNGLFGPGYYLTNDARVAGGLVSDGTQVVRGAYSDATRLPGEVIREGYAHQRVVSEADLRQRYDSLMAAADRAGTPKSGRLTFEQWAANQPPPPTGPNVRAVDVPSGLRLFDVDAPIGPTLLDDLGELMEPRDFDSLRNHMRYNRGPAKNWTNEDVYQELVNVEGGWSEGANRYLQGLGYDGIRYSGGKRIPMADEAGRAIEHTALVVFPDSLSKLRNAISGRQGGVAAGKFATGLGGAGAGGAAGYLTADEDATPEEKIIRGVLGALAGGIAGAGVGALAEGPALAKVVNAVKPSQQAIQAMQRIQQQSPPRSAPETIMNLTRSNLLSPVMMSMQVTGGAIETARRPVGTFLGGLVRADPTSMRAALDDVAAMAKAIPLGLANARDALLTGYRGSRQMFGEGQHPEIGDVASGVKGIAITPAYRFFAMADELVRTVNAHGAMAMAARAESKATGQPFQQIVQNAQMYPWVWKTAQEASARSIYEEGGTGLGKAIAALKKNWLTSGDPGKMIGASVLEVLQPFTMIPDVLTAEGAKIIGHTATLGTAGIAKGIATSRGLTKSSKNLAQPERNLEAARAAGAGILAPMVMTWVASQALAGNVTGQGPKSWSSQYRKELEQTRDENGQPLWRFNSWRVGDRWVNYEQVLGPWAPAVAMAATAVEEWKDTGVLNGETVAASLNGAASAWMKSVYLEDFFRAISRVMDRDITGALEEKAGQTAGRLPFGGLMSGVVRATDEAKQYDRGFEGVGQRVQARIPGLSQNTPDKQGVLGEPLREPQDAVSFLGPGRPTTPEAPGQDDRVKRLFIDARVSLPQPDDRITIPIRGAAPVSIPLKPEEERQWHATFGKYVQQIASELLSDPTFASAPIELRQKVLRDKVLAAARRAADAEMADQLGGPEIDRRLAQDRAAPKPQPFRP